MADPLVEGFRAPPNAASPRVWWHWLGGNISQEGARQDLEWMKRIGIGGVQNFDAAYEGPGPAQFVATPLPYLSPQWRQAFRYSVNLANDLGLEFAIASSPGWSQSGGPWVQPRQAMKKLVWSLTRVRGGSPFTGQLAPPPRTTGLFQNIPDKPPSTNGEPPTPVFYADVATIAYRAPASDAMPLSSRTQAVVSSAGKIDAARLSDGDLATPVSLPFGEGGKAWIQYSYDEPQRVQALTTVIVRGPGEYALILPGAGGWLEASDDGKQFRKVADLPATTLFQSNALQQTVSFPPVVARTFRIVLTRPEPTVFEKMGMLPKTGAYEIAEIDLQTAARVNRFEDKAGYSTRQIVEDDATQPVRSADAIRKRDVVDLTSRVRADGSLDWTPPAGDWIVLRFGYSLTGSFNHPVTGPGKGLEVDKLSSAHVKAYIDAYLGEYERTLGANLVGQRGLQYLITDSYEAGPQNWTDDLLEQFRARCGYDAHAWLPVLTGRVVESAQSSDRFLWDFRQTLADLMADAHYAQIAAAAHGRGMRVYGESQETRRHFVGDGMEVKKTADIPMGAMWAARLPGLTQEASDADIRESASVAHIYGKPLVAAESFTAFAPGQPFGDFPYRFAPADLKHVADRALSMGLNRFVIHASVHQPDDRPGPGIGLGLFGQWFTRKETWAELAGGWTSYLARNSYLLQQGRFVADIAYLYGEDANVTSLFHASTVSIPRGYNFDFVNPGALRGEFSVREGRLVTRSGMEYRVLVLDASTRRLSLPLLRKIRDLVAAGAVVVGARPTASPSLSDDDAEFRAIVAQLWGGTGNAGNLRSARIVADRPLSAVLAALGIEPDVSYPTGPSAGLRFVHRALERGDLYFINSESAQAMSVAVSFRVNGMRPELWRADTGSIAPLSYRMQDGRTNVSLKLDPHDAVFVVFREPTREQSVNIPEPATGTLTRLEGPWDIRFPAHLGAPSRARFERLQSWTDHSDPGVKYFSGVATYARTLSIAREWLNSGSRIELDLGEVKNVAEVFVNGRSLGVLWKAPFKLDITAAARSGANDLEISVANLWVNRLIGDQQPGAQRVAFAALNPFKSDSTLLPSGLLGPVTLQRVTAGNATDDQPAVPEDGSAVSSACVGGPSCIGRLDHDR